MPICRRQSPNPIPPGQDCRCKSHQQRQSSRQSLRLWAVAVCLERSKEDGRFLVRTLVERDVEQPRNVAWLLNFLLAEDSHPFSPELCKNHPEFEDHILTSAVLDRS